MQRTSASGKRKDAVRTLNALHSVAKEGRCAHCLEFHEEINFHL